MEHYFDERPELNAIQIQEIENEASESFYRRSSDISYTLRTPEEDIEVEDVYHRRIESDFNVEEASSEVSNHIQQIIKKQQIKV